MLREFELQTAIGYRNPNPSKQSLTKKDLKKEESSLQILKSIFEDLIWKNLVDRKLGT